MQGCFFIDKYFKYFFIKNAHNYRYIFYKSRKINNEGETMTDKNDDFMIDVTEKVPLKPTEISL